MSNVEKYLNERVIDSGGLPVLSPKQASMIAKVSKELKWEIGSTYTFILRLLENVNARSVVADVTRIFLKDFE